MWIAYAFGSAIFAGLTGILAKLGMRNIDSHLATAIRTIVALFFSWLCYYRALQMGDVSIVVPIDKLSILVTILFSYIVFQETLSKKEWLGLALLVGGTLLLLL